MSHLEEVEQGTEVSTPLMSLEVSNQHLCQYTKGFASHFRLQ